MNLWPLSTQITDTEAVSVTSMQGRMEREGWRRSRRVIRKALKRMARAGWVREWRTPIRAMFTRNGRVPVVSAVKPGTPPKAKPAEP